MAAITLWDGASTLHDVWASDAGQAEDWTSRHWFARQVPDAGLADGDGSAVVGLPIYCGSVYRRDLPSGVGAVRLPSAIFAATEFRGPRPRFVLDLYETVGDDVSYVTSLALDAKLRPAPPSRTGALLSVDPLDGLDRADLECVTTVDGARRAIAVLAVGAGLPPVQPADAAGVVLSPSGGPTIGLMALRRFGLGDGSGALFALGPAVPVGPDLTSEAPLEALAVATLMSAVVPEVPTSATLMEGIAERHARAPHLVGAALRFAPSWPREELERQSEDADVLATVLDATGLGRARRAEAFAEGALGVARLMSHLDREGPAFVEAIRRAGVRLPVRLKGGEALAARSVAVAMADPGFPTRLAEAAAHAERDGVASDAARLRAPLARVAGEVTDWDEAFDLVGALEAWEAARRRQEAADQRAFERVLGRAPPPPDPATDVPAPLDLEALKADTRGIIARLPDRYVDAERRKALVDTVEAYGEDPSRWRWAHGALARLALSMAAPSAALLMVERLETWAGLPGFAARMTSDGAAMPGVSQVTRLMARMTGVSGSDVDTAWVGGDRAPLETLRSALSDEIATFGLANVHAAPGAPAQPSASALLAYGQLLLAHRIVRQVDDLTARVDAALAGRETAGNPELGAVARERQALGWVRHALPDGLGRLLASAARLRAIAARVPETADAVADFAFDFSPPPGPKTGVPSRPADAVAADALASSEASP